MASELSFRTRVHLRVVLLRWRWEKLARQHTWARPLGWLARFWYRLERRLQGARNVDTAGLDGTSGSYEASGVYVSFGGACPVQGHGSVDGRLCYYRSRGEGWQFHVARTPDTDPLDDDEAWVYCEDKYFFPHGGWVSADVSRECIRRAVQLYRAGKGGGCG